MNFFRRLFRPAPALPSQSGNGPAIPAPMYDGPPVPGADAAVAEAPVAAAVATATAADTVELLPMVEGVTRPLPAEPALPLAQGRHLAFGQVSDIGVVRSNNQDAAISFFATPRSVEGRPDLGLFIVADGMGGHHDGERAAAVTARTVAQEITSAVFVPMFGSDDHPASEIPVMEVLVGAVQKANSAVLKDVPDGGTTVTVLVLVGSLAYVAHVGDSRVYIITRDRVERLTRDHSLVQRLIELDQLTPEEAAEHPQKNVLYRALGQSENLEVDALTRRLPPRARVLLCSDGLWNQVDEKDILKVVQANADPQDACKELVARANANGGIDNVTAILVQLPG